jgi:hypothetical protein
MFTARGYCLKPHFLPRKARHSYDVNHPSAGFPIYFSPIRTERSSN